MKRDLAARWRRWPPRSTSGGRKSWLIEAGGRAYLLGEIFLRTGLAPRQILDLEQGEREFVFAAMRVRLEQEQPMR